MAQDGMQQTLSEIQAKFEAMPRPTREERLQETLRQIEASGIEQARARIELNQQLNAAFMNPGGNPLDRTGEPSF